MSKNLNLAYFRNGNIYCFFKTANSFELSFEEVAELLKCEADVVASQFIDQRKLFNQ